MDRDLCSFPNPKWADYPTIKKLKINCRFLSVIQKRSKYSFQRDVGSPRKGVSKTGHVGLSGSNRFAVSGASTSQQCKYCLIKGNAGELFNSLSLNEIKYLQISCCLFIAYSMGFDMAITFHFLGQIICVVAIQDELKAASTTSLLSPYFTTGIGFFIIT